MAATPLIIHETQVSLSFWHGWLYKRLFVRPQLNLGIVELRIGRTNPQQHRHHSVAYYVLDGHGHFIFDAIPVEFESGKCMTVFPKRDYEFDPETPTRLLTVSAAPSFYPQIRLVELLRTERFTSGSLLKMDECGFVCAGQCELRIEDQVVLLRSGTAFYIPSQAEYTIHNTSSAKVKLLNVYVSATQSTDVHLLSESV